jgi:sugar/nucleoside kinase (ribokinase family)
MPLLIVGSVGIDKIITKAGSVENALGGSASYASVSAGFFSRVNLVGVVGDDFPGAHVALLRRRNADLAGLEIVPGGKTFRWTGKYHKNFATRETVEIQLNVFETFRPKIPAVYRKTPYVLLANIDPDLQMMVLDQIAKPRFIAADTMDLWLNLKPGRVADLVKRVDMIVMNDEEAAQFTQKANIVAAGREILRRGVSYAVIKKGAHGAVLFSRKGMFQVPAFPVENVADPTGAGDCFIGGLMGYLASTRRTGIRDIKKGMAFGTVAASFDVEAFGLGRLRRINRKAVDRRFRELVRSMSL